MEGDIGQSVANLGVFLIPIVGSIAMFSFLGVAAWSDAQRKEREAYYNSETVKKLAESPGEGAKAAVEYMLEQKRMVVRNRLEGMKLGGVITAAVGIGLMIFLRGMERQEPVYLVGLIPLLIGAALLVYVLALAPKGEVKT